MWSDMEPTKLWKCHRWQHRLMLIFIVGCIAVSITSAAVVCAAYISHRYLLVQNTHQQPPALQCWRLMIPFPMENADKYAWVDHGDHCELEKIQ